MTGSPRGTTLDDDVNCDLLRQMIQYVAQRMMEMEVESVCAAAYTQRSPRRRNIRNGYRDRSWHTCMGTLDLKIPRLARGSYFPRFLRRRQSVEEVFVAAIREVCIHGAATRSLHELVTLLDMRITESQVAQLCMEIEARVRAFRYRRSGEVSGTADRPRPERSGEQSAGLLGRPHPLDTQGHRGDPVGNA